MNITIGRSGWLGIASIGAFVVTAAACSSSSTPASSPSDASTPEDTGSSSGADSSSGVDSSSGADTGAPPVDGGTEAGVADGASDGGSGNNATLTVMNFLSWCSVTINGGTASTGASVTSSVAVGSTATIVATPAPNSSFQIGPDPWFGVMENDGGAAAGTDNGAGATETSTATVVVTGNQCVSVCCQEPNNSPTPCPATNPCP